MLFAGSGSTGVAALLCEHPTNRMEEIAKSLNVTPDLGCPKRCVIRNQDIYHHLRLKTILSRITNREFTEAVDVF